MPERWTRMVDRSSDGLMCRRQSQGLESHLKMCLGKATEESVAHPEWPTFVICPLAALQPSLFNVSSTDLWCNSVLSSGHPAPL